MNDCKFNITEEMIEWAVEKGFDTADNIRKYDKYDAALLIGTYNTCHNKKCFVYSKMVESASGGEMFDSVTGYLHEDYDSAKAREQAEINDVMNMKIDG